MTRFFYTDPLEAAYMARHFGMRFERHELRQEVYDENCIGWPDYSDFFFVTMGSYHVVDDGDELFVVHADSFVLLEPQVGDLGIDSEGHQCRFADDYDDGSWFVDAVPMTSFDKTEMPVAIDKRNGIHFFWPQRE
jgi:hypothetical protein